jgi:flagellar biosynthesis/type III secretory pathway protein FliH
MSSADDPDDFVALTAFLRPIPRQTKIESPATAPADLPAPLDAQATALGERYDAMLREVRRFRAGLADALDAAAAELLPLIAREVLARELRLAPAEIGEIVRSAVARRGTEVLAIRANPADLGKIADIEIERIADEVLRPGSVLIELRSGTIDLSLDARLEAVVTAWSE